MEHETGPTYTSRSSAVRAFLLLMAPGERRHPYAVEQIFPLASTIRRPIAIPALARQPEVADQPTFFGPGVQLRNRADIEIPIEGAAPLAGLAICRVGALFQHVRGAANGFPSFMRRCRAWREQGAPSASCRRRGCAAG